MLCTCVLDYGEGWFKYLPLVEFAYNNSHQASIEMAPYEALYGCRSPICWYDVGERRMIGLNLVEEAEVKVCIMRQRLLTTPSTQKSYVDQRQCGLEFQVADYVLLKVSPIRGIKQFVLGNKLSPWFVGPFEIL